MSNSNQFDPSTVEIKGLARFVMKDEIQYDNNRLNTNSNLRGMDEQYETDFLIFHWKDKEEPLNDLFSLRFKDANTGIEYGNCRAFFQTKV